MSIAKVKSLLKYAHRNVTNRITERPVAHAYPRNEITFCLSWIFIFLYCVGRKPNMQPKNVRIFGDVCGFLYFKSKISNS